MEKVYPDYLPLDVNQYCPACAMVADARYGDTTRISFGKPVVADTDGIIKDAAALNVDTVTTVLKAVFDGAVGGDLGSRWGRNVTITASAAVGVGTEVIVTVTGRDYLGQPITENITVTHANGTDTQSGLKAFKEVTKLYSDGGGSADETIEVGFGDVLGIPYKAVKVISEEFADAIEGTLGTLVTPVLTDPGTITTGEPRGTYDPQSTLNGTSELCATFIFDNSVNSSGNGGYHGIAHYSA